MSTMNRQCAKNLFKSNNSFSVVKDMVKTAVDGSKPALAKSLGKNRDKLDNCFIDLCLNFKLFKEDIIATDNVTEEEFNENDENGKAKYVYNDQWMENTRNEYYDLIDKSEDILEAQDDTENNDGEVVGKKLLTDTEDLKQKQRSKDALSNQIELFTTSTSDAIDKIRTLVRDMNEDGEGVDKVNSVKSDLHALNGKIDTYFNNLVNQYVVLLKDEEVEEKELMRKTYINKEKVRIDNLLLELSKKVKDNSKSSVIRDATFERKEQTFLKKTEPPRWNGDPVEFSDFVRKWKSQVSTANLPAEAELDRLRENRKRESLTMRLY